VTDQLSFTDVANLLPFGAFLKLQQQISSDDCAVYVRKITGVTRRDRSKDPDRNAFIGVVKYEARKGGKFQDPGEIVTDWLENDAAKLVCEIAKENVGSMALIFQLNKDKSEDQPSGFREIVWLQPLSKPRRESATPVERREPDPPRVVYREAEPVSHETSYPHEESRSEKARREHTEHQERPFTEEAEAQPAPVNETPSQKARREYEEKRATPPAGPVDQEEPF